MENNNIMFRQVNLATLLAVLTSVIVPVLIFAVNLSEKVSTNTNVNDHQDKIIQKIENYTNKNIDRLHLKLDRQDEKLDKQSDQVKELILLINENNKR